MPAPRRLFRIAIAGALGGAFVIAGAWLFLPRAYRTRGTALVDLQDGGSVTLSFDGCHLGADRSVVLVDADAPRARLILGPDESRLTARVVLADATFEVESRDCRTLVVHRVPGHPLWAQRFVNAAAAAAGGPVFGFAEIDCDRDGQKVFAAVTFEDCQ